MLRNIITALDVGTSSVQTVIAERRRGEESLHVLGVGVAPVSGMRRGIVVDIDDVTTAIRASVEDARRATGVPIRSAWLGVGGAHISVASSRGVVAVSRVDGEITGEDVKRALASAETFIPKHPNKEVLHIVPRDFRVDQESGIKDPVGMHGIRLEVDALIIECSSPFLKNLIKCVEGAGLAVQDYVFLPLAASEVALSRRQKELGTMLLDLGAGTTSFIIYEEGVPIHAGVLPFGGGHVTNDIAIGFQTHVDAAEYMKVLHGSCVPAAMPKRESIRLADVLREYPVEAAFDRPLLGAEETAVYSRKELAEIIEARVTDVLELLQKELRKISRAQLLPGGIVVMGGGALTPGLVELVRQELHLPAQLAEPQLFGHAMDDRNAATLLPVFGVLAWAARSSGVGGAGGAGLDRLRSWQGQAWVRWLKSLIP